MKITWRAPFSETARGAPAAMSLTPSRFRSPTEATEEPNRSEAASSGPLAVLPVISTVRFTPPVGLISMTWTAPLSAPPASSSPGAPAAMSGVPSPSTSPAATDAPNASPSSSEGPPGVAPSIPTVCLTPPGAAVISMRWTPPRPDPPPSAPGAPATRSGIPSPSASPAAATEAPNPSPSSSEGPLGVPPFISNASLTPPVGLMSLTWTAPRSDPPASPPGAPAAMSGIPSPSASPMPAADRPRPPAWFMPGAAAESASAGEWAMRPLLASTDTSLLCDRDPLAPGAGSPRSAPLPGGSAARTAPPSPGFSESAAL